MDEENELVNQSQTTLFVLKGCLINDKSPNIEILKVTYYFPIKYGQKTTDNPWSISTIVSARAISLFGNTMEIHLIFFLLIY